MNISILLAEDHELVRTLMRRALEAHADLRVVAALADGHAAVEEALRVKPDVAVLDISMPKLGGVEAAHAIHAALPHTGILMLSAHLECAQIERALRAGAMGYLLKPTAPQELVAAVRAVCAGRRYLSADARAALLA
jgi:DNA-binding NarL/FixJ family response regulator